MSYLVNDIIPTGLTNNFIGKLDLPIDSDATVITISASEPVFSAFKQSIAFRPWFGPSINPFWNQSDGNTVTRYGVPLCLLDGEKMEIIYVLEVVNVGATSGEFLVSRGREGTTAQSFPPESKIEQRLTAGTIASLLGLKKWHASLTAPNNIFHGFGHWTDNKNLDQEDFMLGAYCSHEGSQGGNISIGNACEQEGSARCVSLGSYNWMGAGGGVNQECVVVGAYAGIYQSTGQGVYGSVVIGAYAESDSSGGIALGTRAFNYVNGGLRTTAISYLPKNNDAPIDSSITNSAMQSAMQVTVQSDVISLSSGAATATITLPHNTILLIDSLDWITTASDTPGGTPEIQIGTDATNNNTLLAATGITATGLHERQTFDPLHSNGVTSVHVSVATAGTGTLSGKLVVRGYVMEV